MEHIIETENKSDSEIVQQVMNGYKNSTSAKILKKLEQNEMSDADPTVRRLMNLTGPKTLQGRLKAQANLKKGNYKKETQDNNLPDESSFDPDDPMSSFFLNHKEKVFYDRRKEKYVSEFNLNESVDEAILNQILQEEIVLNRLSSQQKDYFIYLQLSDKQRKERKHVPINPTDEINDARKRFKGAVDLLAAGKKDRKQHFNTAGNDLASLATRYEKEGFLDDDDDLDTELKEVSDYMETAGEERIEALKEFDLED